MNILNLIKSLLSYVETILLLPMYLLSCGAKILLAPFRFLWNFLEDSLGRDKDRVMMMGLNGAGKTSILCNVFGVEEVEAPTAFNNSGVVDMGKKVNDIEVFDINDTVGTFDREQYFTALSLGNMGMIFVIDGSEPSTDEENTQFHEIVTRGLVQEQPLLVFVNKQDIEGCRSVSEVTNSLGLMAFTDRPWHIQGCSAVTGEGLKEGFVELSRMIECFKQKGPALRPVNFAPEVEIENLLISANLQGLGCF